MQISMMKRVYIASPYRSNTTQQRQTFDVYLEHAIEDSICKNEAPFAPHFIYVHFLNDSIPADRNKAIDMANKWLLAADKLAVYADYGISEGMQAEMDLAKAQKKPIEIRRIQ